MCTSIVRWCVFLCLYTAYVYCSTVEDINNLLKTKKTIVNKQVRPVFNQSTATNVYFTYELISIFNFDEVAQKITTVGYFSLWWRDELMDWSPEEYNDLKHVVVSDPDTWLPNLALANPSGKSDVLVNDLQVVRYDEAGWGSISPMAVYESTCSVDVTYYPWDEQECELFFTPWGYSSKEVALIPYKGKIGTTFFTEHGEWDLVNTKTTSYVNAVLSSVATISLKLRRRPTFCIVNALLPIVFMSFLNIFVFMIPVRTGERFSFCITVLLSIAVFLTLIGDSLPRTSEPMSLLSYYLVTLLSASVFIVLANIVSARLFWRKEHIPVTKPWSILARLLACSRPLPALSGRGQRAAEREKKKGKLKEVDTSGSFTGEFEVGMCCRKIPMMNIKEDLDPSNQNTGDSLEHGCYCPQQTAPFASTLSTTDKEGDSVPDIKWEDVSMAFDRACFFVFMTCLTTLTAIFVLTVS